MLVLFVPHVDPGLSRSESKFPSMIKSQTLWVSFWKLLSGLAASPFPDVKYSC